jgi:hypothetical protein
MAKGETVTHRPQHRPPALAAGGLAALEELTMSKAIKDCWCIYCGHPVMAEGVVTAESPPRKIDQ